MQFFKKIIDFYIFSNIHVAIAGFCITKITVLKYGIYESYVPLFVAFSILISYNFIRFYELKTNRLIWLKDWFYNYRIWLLFLSAFSLLIILYIIFFTGFNFKSFLVLFPFAFMTLFYVIPIFKIKKMEISFRNFPSIKIFSIAVSWAGISVLLPLSEAKIGFNFDIFLEFIQRFAMLIVITLPFDIRDLNSDSKTLKTLPQVLGVKQSKFIGILLLIFAVSLEFFKQLVVMPDLILLVSISIITGLFLLFSSENESKYYTSFWVESIPIIWLTLTVVFLDNF